MSSRSGDSDASIGITLLGDSQVCEDRAERLAKRTTLVNEECEPILSIHRLKNGCDTGSSLRLLSTRGACRNAECITFMPLASSSNPNASTTVRAGVKPLESSVSIVALR